VLIVESLLVSLICNSDVLLLEGLMRASPSDRVALILMDLRCVHWR